jgi:hypothetical protein
MIRKLRGKVLEFLLLVVAFVLLVLVLPKSLMLAIAGAAFIVCVVAMVKMNFFGRF